jgi:hypothetical protein
MTIPPSDRHGVWVNDGSGTPKLIHAAWVNDNTANPKAAKEIWINNAQTLTRVWPPRAYVVELVPIGTRHGKTVHLFTAVDTTTLSIAQTNADPQWNDGNWNALWGGMRYGEGPEGSVTYAFRRWDKYDAVGNYDFSTANAVRRTTANGATAGFGHGGLYKNLLQTSPYDPNDKRTHSPFVVIEPNSQILCIRTNFAKSFSQGGDEEGSSPVATIGLYTGNDTYFGSTSTATHSWTSTVTNDIPVTGGEDGAQPAAPAPQSGIFATTNTSNTFFTNFGMVYGKGSGCRFGISTHSSFGSNTLNLGSWMSNKNYGSFPTSTIYGFGNDSNKLTAFNNSANVVPFTLPAPTVSGHVGWKYIQFDFDDSAASEGYVYQNYNIPTSNYSPSDWGAVGVNTSLGSTLFLVIPP